MKEYNNISLVHKSLFGELTNDEKVAYNQWLLEGENDKLVKDLQQIWDLSEAYQPTDFKPNAAAAFHKFKAQINTTDEVSTETKIVKLNPMMWVSRIAASIILVGACFFLFKDSFKSSTEFTKEIYASSITNSSLSDGSEVWLDDAATFSIASSFGNDERRVKLNGKAYFNVDRDEDKPFIVEMGKNRLEVLGTSFNIDHKNETSIVEVESGIVRVSTNSNSAILKAGDKAVLNYASDEIKISKLNSDRFDWYKNSLEIESSSIAEVMKQVSDFYNVKIDLSVNVDQACQLTSPLAKNSSIDELLKVLEATYDMQYEKLDAKHFEIKYLSCR